MASWRSRYNRSAGEGGVIATYERSRDWDAIPSGTCMACGLIGKHGQPGECIDALRQRIATLEIRVNRLEREKIAAKLAPKGE